MILSGANAFPGGTFVTGGVLAVNGSILSEHTFVDSYGTLQGSGWIYGNVINIGLVSPWQFAGHAAHHRQLPADARRAR